MKILDYDSDKLLFDEKTSRGEVVVVTQLEEQIAGLKKDIAVIETAIKDDKKMLEWARQEYGASMGLEGFKQQLAEKTALLAEINK